MPKIRQFKAEDILQIELRQSDLDNLQGVDLEKHGRELALTPESISVLTDEGEIIACIGGFICGSTCLVFLLTSPLVDTCPLLLVRIVKKLFERGVVQGVVRFETLVNMKDTRALRWMQHLGFEREGVCRATGDNLQDRYLYARICLPEEEG